MNWKQDILLLILAIIAGGYEASFRVSVIILLGGILFRIVENKEDK